MSDPAEWNGASYCHHPVDDMEPIEQDNDYREIAMQQLFLLNRVFDWILFAKNPQVAAWQAAFSLGVPCCEGRSMTKVAEGLKVKRQAISKGAIAFCHRNNLPPSEYMKSENSHGSYRKARVNGILTHSNHDSDLVLLKNGGKNGHGIG